MTTSTRKTGNNGPVLRSQSPSGRFYSGSSPFASSSSTAFSSHQSSFIHRSPVNLYASSNSPSSSLKFSPNRPGSPNTSISASKKSGNNPNTVPSKKRTCMCSPTNHPGSFRCSMHKNVSNQAPSGSYPANRLNARRSAMTNSLVRIGTVEGELVKRALATLIRPSSHSQKRRGSFQPKPSRLSVMSKAEDVSCC